MSRSTIPKKGKPTVGDLDFAYFTADQNGWYRLNGRAITALPVTPRANAVALGFAVNLPDGLDRVVRPQGAMGAVGGAAFIAIAAANMPLVHFAGDTPSGGQHDHGMPNTPYLGNTGAPNANTAQSQADVPASTLTINPSLINNTHDHTLTATLQSSAGALPNNAALELRQPYRAFNLFVYLGAYNSA